MYGCLSPPARQSVRTAEAKWSPAAQAWAAFGDALSNSFWMTSGLMSQRWPVKVPEDDTVPVMACVTPQLNERTSISFLCLESLDSPSTPSTFKNTSDGMADSPFYWEPPGSGWMEDRSKAGAIRTLGRAEDGMSWRNRELT